LSTGRFFPAIPAAADREHFEEVAAGDGVRIERIVSHGHASPPGFWYDQESHEWVMVLAGRAGLELEDEVEILELGPGDWVDIPAHRKHRVAWTSVDEPTVWLAVHYGKPEPGEPEAREAREAREIPASRFPRS
jgi:cupin 2 domain-containing protein